MGWNNFKVLSMDNNVNVEYYYRTIQELQDNTPPPFEDPCGYWSAIGPNKREAFLNNITGADPNEICQIIGIVDGVAAGYLTLFTGYALIDGKKVKVQHGSDLFVTPEYRKYMIGAELLLLAKDLQNLPCIFAGFSSDARPLYPRIGFKLFSYPRFVFFYKSRLIAESVLGLSGSLKVVASWIGDFILFFYKLVIYLYGTILQLKYTIEDSSDIPIEFDEINKKQRLRFQELHDKQWLSYNLNYTFEKDKENALKRKKLYLIKNKGKLCGYFVIRSSYQNKAEGKVTLRNVSTAEIKEWDSFDYNKLSELDIHFLAIKILRKEKLDFFTFPVFQLNTISLFKFIFYKRTTFDVAVYFPGAKKKDPINIKENWRVRGGYSDTLID